MQKRIITITLIILFIAGVTGTLAFSYFSKKQTPLNILNFIYQKLENFQKQAAHQMINPLYGFELSENQNEKNSLCQENQDPACYEEYYRALVKNEGVQAAFKDLKSRYGSTPFIAAYCHPLTHLIGQVATDKYPEVSQAYTHGDPFCSDGYYHGVLEGTAFKLGKDKLLASLNSICAKIPGKEKYLINYYNCVHGLGHGLMAITEDELFESIKYCDSLTGFFEQNSCYSGVFMENVMVDNRNHFTKYLRPDEPMYPCSAVENKYKNSCYLIQTSYVLKITGGDFIKVFESCKGVDNASFRATCYQSLGRDASGQNLSNIGETKKTCDLGKGYEQKSNCIIGAVKDFLYFYHSDAEAKQLCGSLDSDLQDICLSTLAIEYQSYQ